jgi:hypothetical protein
VVEAAAARGADTGKVPRRRRVKEPPDTGKTNASIEVAERTDTGKLLESFFTDAAILAKLGSLELGNERINASDWRIEVYTNRNGRRYWNYRRRGKRGGKDNWLYGGKFEDLTEGHRTEYKKKAKR